MKKITNTLVALLMMMSVKSFAQTTNVKFEQAIQKGLEMFAASKTADEFINTSNHFDRIAQVEKKEWVALYYGAYAKLIAGITTEDKALKDKYYDSALVQIDQANLLSPDNSEIYALTGYIQFMSMSVDPQTRYTLIATANASLSKAKELNPDNPRPYLISGQGIFYTPEAYGGGKSKAKPILELSVAKFATFKPTSNVAPKWGAERAKLLLEQCN